MVSVKHLSGLVSAPLPTPSIGAQTEAVQERSDSTCGLQEVFQVLLF